ncbi:hypothetical protein [uncultured Williamsia sp.]|uniref:lipopolysaccharide biosynthesis protein n=1 Tax=uncultured Williamsia sp. TaxID=259311 RepID=UPI0026192635|nr:hypothetical protein [uncultured Williamsia sp.]
MSSLMLGVSLLLIARGTTVDGFGHFMTAYTVGIIVGLAVGFGAPTRILQIGVRDSELAGGLFAVHTFLVTVVSVIACVTVAISGAGTVVLVGVVFAIGDTVQNYAQAHLTARDRQWAANLLVLSHRLPPVVAVAASIAISGRVDYDILIVAYTVPVALGVFAPIADASRAAWRRRHDAFRGSSGYWVYSLAAVIPQLQIPLLALVTVPEVVGEFSLATRVIGPITLLTASLSAVLVPELARRADDPADFAALYRFSMRISAAYLGVVVVAAWPAAMLVVGAAGAQYADAVGLVFATVVAAGIAAFGQAANSVLLAVGKASLSASAIIAGAVVGLSVLLVCGTMLNGGWLWVAPVLTQVTTMVMLVRFARPVVRAPREPSTEVMS